MILYVPTLPLKYIIIKHKSHRFHSNNMKNYMNRQLEIIFHLQTDLIQPILNTIFAQLNGFEQYPYYHCGTIIMLHTDVVSTSTNHSSYNIYNIKIMFSYELSVLSCLRVLLMTPSSNCNLFLDQVSNNLTLPFIFIYNFYVN